MYTDYKMEYSEKTYVFVVFNEVELYLFGVFATEEKAKEALKKRPDRDNFTIEETEVE